MFKSPKRRSERQGESESSKWKVRGRAGGSGNGEVEVNEMSKEEDLGKVWVNKDSDICQGCNSRVNTGQMGIECGGCKKWYHAKCEKLTKKEYEKICEIEEKVMWNCSKCGDILQMLLKDNRKLQQELMSVRSEVSEMKEAISTNYSTVVSESVERLISEAVNGFRLEFDRELKNIIKSSDCFQEKLQDFEKKMKTEVTGCMEEIRSTRNEQARMRKEKEGLEIEVSQNLGKLNKKIEDNNQKTRKEIDVKFETKTQEFIRERVVNEDSMKHITNLKEELEGIKEYYKKGTVASEESRTVRNIQEQVQQLEKDKRKRNVMIFNLAESTKSESKERYEDDKAVCKEIFRKLEIGVIEIETTVRIGKTIPNKARPLLVKLTSDWDTRKIMQEKKKLKQIENYRSVYIEKDLTVEEREQNRKLRRELNEKRAEGKSRYIIKGGKVVELEGSRRDMSAGRGKTEYEGGRREQLPSTSGLERESRQETGGGSK